MGKEAGRTQSKTSQMIKRKKHLSSNAKKKKEEKTSQFKCKDERSTSGHKEQKASPSLGSNDEKKEGVSGIIETRDLIRPSVFALCFVSIAKGEIF